MVHFIAPKPNELKVSVSRRTADKAYLPIRDGKYLFATGPCGSGKSTYALAGLLSTYKLDTLVIQPSPAAKSAFDKNISGLRSKFHLRGKIDATDAGSIMLTPKRSRRRVESAGLVVVDEIHTPKAEVAFAVMLARQCAKSYILITATPEGDAYQAQGEAYYQIIDLEDVSYPRVSAYSSLSSTMFDPNIWPKAITSLITYPVTNHLRDVMTKFYRTRGMKVSVVNPGETFNKADVYLIMPGVGDGLTLNADMLIDTGYTAKKVMKDGILHYTICRLDEAEANQRWARVGRNDGGVVVRPESSYAPREFPDVELIVALIACSAADLNMAKCVREFALSKDLRNIDPKVAASSINSRTPLMKYVSLAGMGDPVHRQCLLFMLPNYAIPAPILDLTSNFDYSNMVKVLKVYDTSMSFNNAVNTYKENKGRYRYALLALVYGRVGRYESPVNAGTHLRKRLGRISVQLDDMDYAFIIMNCSITKRKHGVFYTNKCPWTDDNMDLCDSKDFKSGKPQKRFAAAVSWMSKLTKVKVRQSSTECCNKFLAPAFSTKALLMQSGDIERNPGPFADLISRLTRLSNTNGYAVVMKKVNQGERINGATSWSELDEMHRNREPRRFYLSGSCLVVYYSGEGSGDNCWMVNKKGDVNCIKPHCIQIASAEKLRKSYLEPITLHYINYRQMEVKRRAYEYSYNEAPKLTDRARVVHKGYICTDRYSLGSMASRWNAETGHSILFWVVDESDVCDGSQDFQSLKEVRKHLNKTMRAVHLNQTVLIVYVTIVEEETSTTVVIDRNKCNVQMKSAVIAEKTKLPPLDVIEMSYINRIGEKIIHWIDFTDEPISPVVPREKNYEQKSTNSPMSSITSRHSTAISDMLLQCGDVEENPGPGNAKKLISNFDGYDIIWGDDSSSNTDILADGDIESNPGPGDDESYRPAGPSNDPGSMLKGKVKGRLNFGPAQLNSDAKNKVGRYLSESEIKTLIEHCKKYGPSFYPSLLDYLIKTDGSDKRNDTDTLEINGKDVKWEQVILELEGVLEKDRFTIRRFATALADDLLILWTDGKYFQEMRENNQNPLTTSGIEGVDSIYIMSWMKHKIPTRLRTKVHQYQSSRAIEISADFVGSTSAFNTNVVSSDGRPGSTKYHKQ